MSCDEAVMKRMGADIRAEYAQSLLRFATGRKFSAATPLAFGEGDTKERIKNVMQYKKPILWVSIIAVIAVVCVLGGLIMNPEEKETDGYAGVDATILEIDKQNKTMTVEGIADNSVIGDRCIITWEGAELITIATNSDISRLSIDDFAVGDHVVLFIGEVQESYPTGAKASTIQLQPSGAQPTSLKAVWESRTKYVGDNSAVGNIISGLSFPDKLKHNGIELHTSEPPYSITVNFKTDTDTKNFYTGAHNQTPLTQNAIILFSLIENAEQIIIKLDDGKTPYAETFYRESAQAMMGGENLFTRTETFEGFSDFIKEVEEKMKSGVKTPASPEVNTQ